MFFFYYYKDKGMYLTLVTQDVIELTLEEYHLILCDSKVIQKLG